MGNGSGSQWRRCTVITTQAPVLVQDDMTIWFATDAARDVAMRTFLGRIQTEQAKGYQVSLLGVDGKLKGLPYGITVMHESGDDLDAVCDILMDIAIEYRAKIVDFLVKGEVP